MGTLISWTDETWNPVTGCSRVSEGCRHCYAATLSARFGWTKKPWTAPYAAENVVCHPTRLGKPATWKTPKRVFVNSMSDLFHPQVPDEFIARVFDVMVAFPQHTFQILTKRPERAAIWSGPWAENIWMGTSVEDHRVVHRINSLRQCKAMTRFISFEPLIGPVGWVDLAGIDWAIVGGESGPGYRPMDHAWARQIRDQCDEFMTAFFFKQSAAPRTEMGTSLIHEDGTRWEWRQFPGHLIPPVPVTDLERSVVPA